jgi:hypothetical protein
MKRIVLEIESALGKMRYITAENRDEWFSKIKLVNAIQNFDEETEGELSTMVDK